MKTREEIKKKIEEIKAEQRQDKLRGDTMAYIHCCYVLDLLNWIIEE